MHTKLIYRAHSKKLNMKHCTFLIIVEINLPSTSNRGKEISTKPTQTKPTCISNLGDSKTICNLL